MYQKVVPATEQNSTQANETVIELISVFDPKPAYVGASPAFDWPTAALPREICDAMSAPDLIPDAPGAIAVVYRSLWSRTTGVGHRTLHW
jgi:hypothetical protein